MLHTTFLSSKVASHNTRWCKPVIPILTSRRPKNQEFQVILATHSSRPAWVTLEFVSKKQVTQHLYKKAILQIMFVKFS